MSRRWKLCAVVILLGLNAFFVYFTLLRALERGVEWQRMYVLACIVQALIDIFLYETTECLLVHFAVPSLVHKELVTAFHSLCLVVCDVCNRQTKKNQDMKSSVPILNSPRYFHVSYGVAKAFPQHLESGIVLSHHSHMPSAELYRRFHSKSSSHHEAHTWLGYLRRIAVLSMLMQLLKQLGALPSGIQRAIIHAVEPMLVAVLTITWLGVYNQPLYSIPVGLLCMYGVYMIYKRYRNYRFQRVKQVVPQSVDSLSEPAVNEDSSGRHKSRLQVGQMQEEVKSDDDWSDHDTTFEELVRSLEQSMDPAVVSESRHHQQPLMLDPISDDDEYDSQPLSHNISHDAIDMNSKELDDQMNDMLADEDWDEIRDVITTITE